VSDKNKTKEMHLLADDPDALKSWLETQLFYVATPYSHPSEHIRRSRFQAACDVTAMLLQGGTLALSPIAHGHPVACSNELPTGFDFWSKLSTALIARCNGIIVVLADGWERSVGIKAEIEIAEKFGLPLFFLPFPADYEDWLYTLRLHFAKPVPMAIFYGGSQ